MRTFIDTNVKISKAYNLSNLKLTMMEYDNGDIVYELYDEDTDGRTELETSDLVRLYEILKVALKDIGKEVE